MNAAKCAYYGPSFLMEADMANRDKQRKEPKKPKQNKKPAPKA